MQWPPLPALSEQLGQVGCRGIKPTGLSERVRSLRSWAAKPILRLGPVSAPPVSMELAGCFPWAGGFYWNSRVCFLKPFSNGIVEHHIYFLQTLRR